MDVVIYGVGVEGGYGLVKGQTTIRADESAGAVAGVDLGELCFVYTTHGVTAGSQGDGVVGIEASVAELIQCSLDIGFWLRYTARLCCGCVLSTGTEFDMGTTAGSCSHHRTQGDKIRHYTSFRENTGSSAWAFLLETLALK